ncbi:MAG: 5'-nucleotidase C-terminal domain-containing protein [Gemmatimonadaceae bacterium]
MQCLPRLATIAALTLEASCVSQPLYQGTPPVDIVVAATTDTHGYIRGWDYYANAPDTVRGLSRVATIMDSLKKVSTNLPVIVDAGDILEGNAMAYAAARIDTLAANPIILAMNTIGYDAAAVGNHEFNYGLNTLDRAVKQADFPFISANIYNTNGELRYRPWAISTRRGVKIAIVGATTPGVMLWDRDNVAGRVVVKDIVPAVRMAVRDARDAGAGVVIVVAHSGLNEPSSYDTASTGVPSENVAARLAREVPGIDLIVYGHSHKEMPDTVIGTTLLMQPKNWATSVAIAHLKVERQNGRWHVTAKRSGVVQAINHKENAAELAATQEGHRAALRYVSAVIGTTSVPWRADSARVVDTPLIDFILEVERKAAGTQLASTAAFSLDASLAAGPITVARMAALYPYDNTLRAVRITGAQLKAYLEQSARYFRARPDGTMGVDPGIPGYNFDIVSGVDYTIDVSKPIGARITTLSFNGTPVSPNDSFTMALNNYRQTGGGGYGMLRDAPVVYDKQQEIRQLLIDEVRRKGTLVPADYFHPHWRIVPAAAIGDILHSPK